MRVRGALCVAVAARTQDARAIGDHNHVHVFVRPVVTLRVGEIRKNHDITDIYIHTDVCVCVCVCVCVYIW